MNTKHRLAIFLGAAGLALLGGCVPAQTEPEPKVSTKTTASEIPGCPKYQAFITNFATDILDCAQSNDIEGCVPDIIALFEPVYTCLEIEMPAEGDLTSFNDLIDMSTEIGNAVSEFDNDPSKATAFVDCLCGTSTGGGGTDGQLSGSFDGSTDGASSSFTGSTTGASGSFTGSTNGASGSFTGSTKGATSAFGD